MKLLTTSTTVLATLVFASATQASQNRFRVCQVGSSSSLFEVTQSNRTATLDQVRASDTPSILVSKTAKGLEFTAQQNGQVLALGELNKHQLAWIMPALRKMTAVGVGAAYVVPSGAAGLQVGGSAAAAAAVTKVVGLITSSALVAKAAVAGVTLTGGSATAYITLKAVEMVETLKMAGLTPNAQLLRSSLETCVTKNLDKQQTLIQFATVEDFDFGVLQTKDLISDMNFLLPVDKRIVGTK